jgi:hypothetical protein
MPYLQPGETYRSRIEELLSMARNASDGQHERYLREAVAITPLIEPIPMSYEFAEASRDSETTAYEFDPSLISIDDAVAAFDRIVPLLTEQGLGVLRPAFLDSLAALSGTAVSQGVEVPTEKIYTFTDDPRVDDSIVYGDTGGDASTRLPTEQLPATDKHPEVDFEEEVDEAEEIEVFDGSDALGDYEDLTAEEIAERQRIIDTPPTPETEPDEFDEDFDGKPAKTETGFEKLKATNKKKGSKK